MCLWQCESVWLRLWQFESVWLRLWQCESVCLWQCESVWLSLWQFESSLLAGALHSTGLEEQERRPQVGWGGGTVSPNKPTVWTKLFPTLYLFLFFSELMISKNSNWPTDQLLGVQYRPCRAPNTPQHFLFQRAKLKNPAYKRPINLSNCANNKSSLTKTQL